LANFRKNHGKSGRRSSFVGRAAVVTASFIGIIIYGFLNLYVSPEGEISTKKQNQESDGYYNVPLNLDDRSYIPNDNSDVVHHKYYSIGYNTELELPNWVAYKLTESSLRVKNVKRDNRFKTDNKVKGRSAKHSDYTHSGYTRGHMAPAGDMAFSKDAMQESFYMSNMTPQLRTFNNGIWRELEENVRDWAYDNDELYIVSGSIFNGRADDFIGKSTKIAVPDAFYKAILDIEGSKQKSIGFIIPHSKSDKHLRDYAVSIDALESQIGYDLFGDLITDDVREEKLESTMNVNQWQIDKKRFKQRVNHWNRQK